MKNAEEQKDNKYTEDATEYSEGEQGSSSEGSQDSEKAAQKKAALYAQANKGEIKEEGYYPFYKIFRFIAGFALFMALASTGVLICLVYRLVKGAGNTE